MIFPRSASLKRIPFFKLENAISSFVRWTSRISLSCLLGAGIVLKKWPKSFRRIWKNLLNILMHFLSPTCTRFAAQKRSRSWIARRSQLMSHFRIIIYNGKNRCLHMLVIWRDFILLLLPVSKFIVNEFHFKKDSDQHASKFLTIYILTK